MGTLPLAEIMTQLNSLQPKRLSGYASGLRKMKRFVPRPDCACALVGYLLKGIAARANRLDPIVPSEDSADMRTKRDPDAELLEQARRLTGIRGKTALLRAGLEALIAHATGQRLAALGGSERHLKPVRRRRAGRST